MFGALRLARGRRRLQQLRARRCGALHIACMPGPLAERVWALRQTVTAYDGRYVALAEDLDAPLAALDVRLAQRAGLGCRFRAPHDHGAP